MPSFDADFTAGTTVGEWLDPASVSTPSRLNAFAEHPHLRHKGTTGTQVEVTAVVGGVSAPLDTALGGNLFALTWAEFPSPPPPASSPAGQTSIQRFTPLQAGHYTFKLARPSHGAIVFHLDVLDP